MNRRHVYEKAVRFALRTGDIPNVKLIWARQEAEGFEACFGTFSGEHCCFSCVYRESCAAISSERVDQRIFELFPTQTEPVPAVERLRRPRPEDPVMLRKKSFRPSGRNSMVPAS